MANELPIAVVVGVGPGLGAALARRFAQAYRVAIVARKQSYLDELSAEIRAAGGQVMPVAADVADPKQIPGIFAQVRSAWGPPEVLLYNAAMRPFGRLMETKASTFENTWRVCTYGAFLCAQEVVPAMLAAGQGVILFTGATAGVKPFATSAAFGPAKFAMRGLGQLMARDLGPQGIHVAWINVDGPIDMPFIRKLRPDAKEEDLLKPSAIAETFWHVAHQDRSAWTQELDVRPFKEKF